jgi:hypothetical protein
LDYLGPSPSHPSSKFPSSLNFGGDGLFVSEVIRIFEVDFRIQEERRDWYLGKESRGHFSLFFAINDIPELSLREKRYTKLIVRTRVSWDNNEADRRTAGPSGQRR